VFADAARFWSCWVESAPADAARPVPADPRATRRDERVRAGNLSAFAWSSCSGAAGSRSASTTDQRGHRDAYLGQIRADAFMYAIVEAIGSVAVAS